MDRYDDIIIGSGLGGLLVGAILSKEGRSVCVVEKEPFAGGCLRSFSRKGVVFDTGMHYMGCMDDGEILNHLLHYCGAYDSLRLRRMDEEFDTVHLDGEEYAFRQGYDPFIEGLAAKFPLQRKQLTAYAAALRQVGESIGVERLRQGVLSSGGAQFMSLSASDEIDQTIDDPLLRSVIDGRSLLYDGQRGHTPFYVHAMINHSFIRGAYRFEGGSQQLADALCRAIERNGGEIRCGEEVMAVTQRNGRISGIQLKSGEVLEANEIVSDIHPARLLDLIDPKIRIRPSYKARIQTAKNSTGMFSVFATVDKAKFPYLNRNHFLVGDSNSDGLKMPTVMLSMQPHASEQLYEAVTLLRPMAFEEVAQWSDTLHEDRGEEYLQFKQQRAEEAVACVEEYFPGFRSSILHLETATPLTYRDYTATPGGSAYGMTVNCNNVMETLLSPATKVEGLFLTGQNVAVHGALGVAMTALSTCGAMLGNEYIARKIGNWNE